MFLFRRTFFHNKGLTKIRLLNSPNSLIPFIPTTILQPIYRNDRTILLCHNKKYFTTFKEDDMIKFEEQIENLETKVFGKSYNTENKATNNAESVKINSQKTKDLESELPNMKYIQKNEIKNLVQDNNISLSTHDSNEKISNKNTQKHVSKTCNECNIPHNTDGNSSIKNNIDQEANHYDELINNRIVYSTDILSRTDGNSAKKYLKVTSNDIESNTSTEGESKDDELSNSQILQETMNRKTHFGKNENTKDDSSAPDILQQKLQHLKEQSFKSKEKDKQKKLLMKIKELQNELLRSYAVQENIRQSLKADAEITRSVAITNFARNIIQTSDNLTQTIESIPGESRTNDVISTIYEGLQMMDMSLMKAFQKAGLTKLGVVGESFDCKKHVVLKECTHDKQVNGTISFVTEIGFALEGVVLRKANVSLTKYKKEN